MEWLQLEQHVLNKMQKTEEEENRKELLRSPVPYQKLRIRQWDRKLE